MSEVEKKELTTDEFIENQKAILEESSKSEIAILDSSKNLVINGVDDKEGFKRVDEARKKFKSSKSKINNLTKEIAAIGTKFSKEIKAKGAELAAPFIKAESEAINKIDDWKLLVSNHEAALAKAAAELFKKRTDKLFEMEFSFNGELYILEELKISVERIQTASEEEWISVIDLANEESNKILQRRAEEMEVKRKQEEAAAKIKEEEEKKAKELADKEAALAAKEKALNEKLAALEAKEKASQRSKMEETLRAPVLEEPNPILPGPEQVVKEQPIDIGVLSEMRSSSNGFVLPRPVAKSETKIQPSVLADQLGKPEDVKHEEVDLCDVTPSKNWLTFDHPAKNQFMRVGYHEGVNFMIKRVLALLDSDSVQSRADLKAKIQIK